MSLNECKCYKCGKITEVYGSRWCASCWYPGIDRDSKLTSDYINNLESLLKDCCDAEEECRNTARRVLGAWVDGDTHHVPPVGEIVEQLVERVEILNGFVNK